MMARKLALRYLRKASPFIGGVALLLTVYNNCGKQGVDPQASEHSESPINTTSLNLVGGENLSGMFRESTEFVSEDLSRRLDDPLLLRDERGRPVEVVFRKITSVGVLAVTTCQTAPGSEDVYCQIAVNELLNPELLEDELLRESAKRKLMTVIRHEIGHAFGMDHVESRKHIMYPYFLSYHQSEPAIESFVADLALLRKDGSNSGIPIIKMKK